MRVKGERQQKAVHVLMGATNLHCLVCMEESTREREKKNHVIDWRVAASQQSTALVRWPQCNKMQGERGKEGGREREGG